MNKQNYTHYPRPLYGLAIVGDQQPGQPMRTALVKLYAYDNAEPPVYLGRRVGAIIKRRIYQRDVVALWPFMPTARQIGVARGELPRNATLEQLAFSRRYVQPTT